MYIKGFRNVNISWLLPKWYINGQINYIQLINCEGYAKEEIWKVSL